MFRSLKLLQDVWVLSFIEIIPLIGKPINDHIRFWGEAAKRAARNRIQFQFLFLHLFYNTKNPPFLLVRYDSVRNADKAFEFNCKKTKAKLLRSISGQFMKRGFQLAVD